MARPIVNVLVTITDADFKFEGDSRDELVNYTLRYLLDKDITLPKNCTVVINKLESDTEWGGALLLSVNDKGEIR
jgi:hypothetical protein